MNSNQQISRGLERLMCRAEGARLEGMFGLAGIGRVDNFRDLTNVASDAGLSGVDRLVTSLKEKHERKCERMRDALPHAVAVKKFLDELFNGEPATLDEQLGAISAAKLQKSAAKTAKTIEKARAIDAKHDAKIAAKVAKLEAKGKTASVAKVLAKEAKHDTKRAALEQKRVVKLDAAQKAIQSLTQPVVSSAPKSDPIAPPPLTPSAVLTPIETAAAVLAQQSGITATTPAAQAFTQEVVANAANPGSTIPTQSLFAQGPSAPSGGGGGGGTESAPAAESGGGFFDNVSPVALAGGAVGVFLLVKAMSGKRS